ncbi:hypothetical protein [Bacteroides difficilis]|uniref:hypothetical protein n=1 Tax=Bacteroides difficilis TaxID=2763021 RepID=UPI003AAB5C7B
MTYRLQEILRMVIPGLYLIILLFVTLTFNGVIGLDKVQTFIKDCAAVIVLLLPFVGFVVGYIIECLLASLEHGWYFFGGRRPSKTILTGCKLYPLADIDTIKIDKKLANDVTNKACGKVLQTAKQKIDRSEVESFQYTSILTRNLFGSQLLFTIFITFVLDKIGRAWLITSLFLDLLFLIYWIHHNHIYVKYVLAEYIKILTSESTKEV